MKMEQVLKECRLFSTLNGAALEKIASLAVEKEYDAGATIFREGDSAECLLVLAEGKVALQIALPEAPGGMVRRGTVDVVTKSEIVGWSAIVEPYIYTLAAVCLQKTKVLSLNGVKLRGLLRDNQLIGYEILKELVKVVASRLDDTRQVLISERALTLKAA